MSSQEEKRHFQGLQIEDGLESDPSSGRIWLAAFMLREAILVAPENMSPEEEHAYFETISRFTVDISFPDN